MVQVSYTRQKEPLGLGHAVLVARDLVGDEPFAVLLGDVLIPGRKSRHQATHRRLRSHRRRRHRRRRSAPRSHSSLRHRRRRARAAYRRSAIACCASAISSKNPSRRMRRRISRLPGATFCRPRFSIAWRAPSRALEAKSSSPTACGFSRKSKGCGRYIYEGISYDAGDKLGFLKATVEIALQNTEFGEEFRELS